MDKKKIFFKMLEISDMSFLNSYPSHMKVDDKDFLHLKLGTRDMRNILIENWRAILENIPMFKQKYFFFIFYLYFIV